MANEKYAQNVGQGQASPDPTAAYDKAHGKYEPKSPEPQLPTAAMPLGAEPTPFALGSGGGK